MLRDLIQGECTDNELKEYIKTIGKRKFVKDICCTFAKTSSALGDMSSAKYIVELLFSKSGDKKNWCNENLLHAARKIYKRDAEIEINIDDEKLVLSHEVMNSEEDVSVSLLKEMVLSGETEKLIMHCRALEKCDCGVVAWEGIAESIKDKRMLDYVVALKAIYDECSKKSEERRMLIDSAASVACKEIDVKRPDKNESEIIRRHVALYTVVPLKEGKPRNKRQTNKETKTISVGSSSRAWKINRERD
ncbi:hypothetical protein TetV_272 [Tetraselmis virus 1]|uniref:Uncharacterized protein n=1 Tax=Tetraselmis virus 1 TaxID=2060617 RepID=A0A2P0VN86_9VIRU|nr:hypothetical protein QJ968_gp272 [Tetraselmis virus 1]AUF82364.1 hypothetical protein TetV_272 [Tetraselmis virus 1]